MEIASGTRYGMLTVIGMERRERDCRPMWRCLCDCGRETLASGNQLESGDKKSCGCLGRSLRVDTSHLRAGLEAFRAARREERTREALAARERLEAAKSGPGWEEAQMRRNQEAGMAFDDMWMFGDCHAVARLKTMFR